MPPEPNLPPYRIKELARAAIVKRKETKKAAGDKPARTVKVSERALLELTKSLCDFYGFAAAPRTTKEHRMMAELTAQTWVPLGEYERQVHLREQAEQRVRELQRDVANLNSRLDQNTKDVQRLKAVVRAALARLILDTQEKHVREEWAVLLLKRIELARDILGSEAVDAPADPGA